jgi:hypothetical protein
MPLVPLFRGQLAASPCDQPSSLPDGNPTLHRSEELSYQLALGELAAQSIHSQRRGDSLAAKDLLQPTTAFRAPTEAGDTFDSVERSVWNTAQTNRNPKRSSSVASLSPEEPTEHNRDGNKKLVPNQFIHFHTGPLTKTPSEPPELLTPTEVEANTPDGQEGSEKHRPQRKAKPRCIRSNFLSKYHSATSRRSESQLYSTQAGSHLTVNCM